MFNYLKLFNSANTFKPATKKAKKCNQEISDIRTITVFHLYVMYLYVIICIGEIAN